MGKVIKLAVHKPEKFGYKKVKRRSKVNLEDFGQLNLFAQNDSKVVALPGIKNFFEEAIQLDSQGSNEAERYYLLAIDNDEFVEDALCNLGILKSGQGDHISAVDYLTKCLEINPRHFEAHYNLGNVYSDLTNFELARVHYELACQITPEFPNSYYNLGLVLISLKDYKRALNCINSYIEISHDVENSEALELMNTLKSIAK